MSAVIAYLAMGGYAVYVWPAYGLATAVLGGLSGYFWLRYRNSERSLDRLQSREERR
ncbi:MAG TPA: heme exporter protein CcmD [Stellaceae bacterium]